MAIIQLEAALKLTAKRGYLGRWRHPFGNIQSADEKNA